MIWIGIKVIADMLSAYNAMLAKDMLEYRVADRRLYLLSIAIVAIPFAGVGLFYLMTAKSVLVVFIAGLTGMTYITAGHFYYRAMSVEQPSRLSLISRCGAVFTVFCSIVILHENLTPFQYIGCGLSFSGGLVLIVKRTENILHLDKSVRDVLLCNMFGSVSLTLRAYLMQQYSAWQTFTMMQVGVIIGTIILLRPGGLVESIGALYRLQFCDFRRLIGEQLIRIGALFLRNTAVDQIGSVMMVSVLSGFRPLYIWIMAVLKRLEPIHDQGLWRKVLAFTMFIGTTYLMTKES